MKRFILFSSICLALVIAATGCPPAPPPTTGPTTAPSVNTQWLADLAFAQQVVNDASIVIPFLPPADQVIATAAMKLVSDGIANAEAAINSGASPLTISQLIAQVVQDAKNLTTTPAIVSGKAALAKRASKAPGPVK